MGTRRACRLVLRRLSERKRTGTRGQASVCRLRWNLRARDELGQSKSWPPSLAECVSHPLDMTLGAAAIIRLVEPLLVITNSEAGSADQRSLDHTLSVLRAATDFDVAVTSNSGDLNGCCTGVAVPRDARGGPLVMRSA